MCVEGGAAGPVIVSGGGPLAAAFAVLHPERVSALAVVCSVPPPAEGGPPPFRHERVRD